MYCEISKRHSDFDLKPGTLFWNRQDSDCFAEWISLDTQIYGK